MSTIVARILCEKADDEFLDYFRQVIFVGNVCSNVLIYRSTEFFDVSFIGFAVARSRFLIRFMTSA